MSQVLRLSKLEQAEQGDIGIVFSAVSSSAVPRGSPESQAGDPSAHSPEPTRAHPPGVGTQTQQPAWLASSCLTGDPDPVQPAEPTSPSSLTRSVTACVAVR
jgi:hypothetical protein